MILASSAHYNSSAHDSRSNFTTLFTFCGELAIFRLVAVSRRSVLFICNSRNGLLISATRLFFFLLLCSFLCVRRHFGYLINTKFILHEHKKTGLRLYFSVARCTGLSSNEAMRTEIKIHTSLQSQILI